MYQYTGPGMRPKQSLGQNFLRDGNIITRIVETFAEMHSSRNSETRVVEVGPGLGALTSELVESFSDMHAIEIDQRAIAHLSDTYPSLSLHHGDVLQTDWAALSEYLGAPLSVIGNIPYNIVSQILLSLLEAPEHCVRVAHVMMQREVASRVVATPRTKAYGILSVVAQLYAKPTILFNVPAQAFSPVPNVASAMVQLDFVSHDDFDTTNVVITKGLKTILKSAFGQRRKVMRNSLRNVCEVQEVPLPSRWESKRAEELTPIEFIQLTQILYQKELKLQILNGSDNQGPSRVWR